MEADLKARMGEDLKRKLDRLYSMKMQPSLHLSQSFDSIINSIDYDAERILQGLGKKAKGAKERKATKKINEVRCELVRILKALEKHIQNQLSANESKKLDVAFVALERRVKEFQEIQVNQEDDFDDVDSDDSYAQLVLDIAEMTNNEQRKVFGNQTIYYLGSTEQSKLGNLVHLTGVTLTDEQLDYLKVDLEGRFKSWATWSSILKDIEQRFNRSLVVSVSLPLIVTKEIMVIKIVDLQMAQSKTDRSQVFQLISSVHDYLGYSVDTAIVDQIFLQEDLLRDPIKEDSIEGFSCNIKESGTKSLRLNGNSFKSLDPCTLSGFEVLEDLDLSNNRLDSLDEEVMARWKNLRKLSLVDTFHPDAKFSLSFLPSISEKVTHVKLTLPDRPVDFSVFSQMINLKELTLHGSTSQDSNREAQKLDRQHLAQINTNRLESLSLTHFNLHELDQETLTGFEKLGHLSLKHCQITQIHPDAFDARWTALKKLDLSCNQLSHLTDNMFARLSSLETLDLNLNEISDLSSGCFRGLGELDTLNLRGNRLHDMPPTVFEGLVNLRSLELAWNNLKRVNREWFKFQDLKSLSSLDLDHNPIDSIEGDAFASCSELDSLSLRHCQLKAINNRWFTGLDSLRDLDLSFNLIDSFEIKTDDGESIEIKSANSTPRELEMVRKNLFPDSFLYSMYYLRLQGNRFTKLNLNVFGNLGNLFEIDLSSNEIDELNNQWTDGFLNESESVEIDLSNNRLACVSKHSFPANAVLKLANNPISMLDNDLSTPLDASESNLHLALGGAMFEELNPFDPRTSRPPVVDLKGIGLVSADGVHLLISNSQPQATQSILEQYDLKESSHLFLHNCSLKTIDGLNMATQFKNLSRLDLRWNKLDRFETCWIQGINNLHKLCLRGNLIEALDDANLFTNCPKLYSLDLSSNRLRSINRRLLRGLGKLVSLDLSDNPELCSIDDGLFRSLLKVTEINLSGNNIKHLNLPKLFKSCRCLIELDLSNNQLDNRTFNQANVGQFSVGKLLLNNNQIENIEFVRDMTQLCQLELSNNKIESIEKDGYNLLGRLRSLERLDLSKNRIKTLSKDLFANLEHELLELDVSGNLFESEPGLGLRLSKKFYD